MSMMIRLGLYFGSGESRRIGRGVVSGLHRMIGMSALNSAPIALSLTRMWVGCDGERES